MTTPPSSLYIRPMQAGDEADAAQLLGALGYPTTAVEVAARFAACQRQADLCLLVAEQQQQLVGLCQLQRVSGLVHAPYAHLAALVVAPQCHGQGIGRQLVDSAMEWARHQGLNLLRLRSADHRHGAHAFYTRLGFVQGKTSLSFELTVPCP